MGEVGNIGDTNFYAAYQRLGSDSMGINMKSDEIIEDF